jgi:hypothetical protein
MAEGLKKSLGYAQYTAAAGVRKFADTPATGAKAPDNAYECIITVEAQNIRWRDDAQNPTATVGMLLKPTDPPFSFEGDLDNFRWIEAVAGAIVNVSYYK